MLHSHWVLSEMGPDGRFGRHRGGGFLGFLLLLIVVCAVVALVTWLMGRRRYAGGPTPPAMPHTPSAPHAPSAPSTTHQAEVILAERLARGEISPDDYRTTLAALRSPAGGG